MSEEIKEEKQKKAKKEKEEIVIPELSGYALTLKENLSYETAMTRLNQISGFKFELKEYKRSKDVKVKIKSFKGLENSGLNFEDFADENNSFKNEEDAAYALLAHIGYTLEKEQNYKNAMEDGRDKFSREIIYSKSSEESSLGEIGVPVRTELTPGMSFVQMMNYERQAPSEKVKSKGLDEYMGEALLIADVFAAKYKEEKKAEEALAAKNDEKQDKVKPVENKPEKAKRTTKKMK